MRREIVGTFHLMRSSIDRPRAFGPRRSPLEIRDAFAILQGSPDEVFPHES
jgi:hypothetical protein